MKAQKIKKLNLGSSLTTFSSKSISLVLFVLVFAGLGSYLLLSTHAASGTPLNTVTPSITGDTVQGSTLTANSGTWANSPTSYTYQWQDCIGPTCTSISGATNSTYVIQSSDLGKSLSVLVTASNTIGSSTTASYNTAAATSTSVSSSNFVSEAYWLGWDSPSVSSFNWSAYNRIMLFDEENAAPSQSGTTTGSTISQGSSISSISASVTATIPAGPIMITTDSSSPSSGSYQILTTTGAASGATSIPITGSPVANADYASGSAVMTYAPNTTNFRWSGSTLSNIVNTAHSHNDQVWVSMGGEGDNWDQDCDNGFQYLTGAWYANFIKANSLDGFNEDNEWNQSQANFVACANAIGQEVHSIATYNNKVPGMELDWNATDNVPANASTLGQTNANIDAYELEYYGYNPSNSYNCSANCGGPGWSPTRTLTSGEGGGIPSEKWIDIYAGGYPDSPQGAQAATTLLSSTTSSASGSVNSISISGVAAAGSEAAGTIPAGLIVIANTSSTSTVPTSYQYLETSGVTGCTSSCSLPITGSCTNASWNISADTKNCTSSTTLNASYSSGSGIWLDEIGYPFGGYNTGGYDCGTMTSWAAENNLLGSSNWYIDGTTNGTICNDTIQPFVNATQTTSPSPTATLQASPTSITTGSSSTLTWSSANATSCSANSPSGWTSSTSTSGSQSVSPTSTTVYSLTCTGSGGTTSATATVTVTGGGGGGSTPPSVPTGLTDINLTADPSEALLTSTATTITVTWNASTPSSGNTLAGYKLYRNGTLVTTVPAGTTMYTDSNLSPGTSYNYTVAAYDTAGNVSSQTSASALSTSSLIGDLDGDGGVTGHDLITLLRYYNTNYPRAEFDCTGTGTCDNVVEGHDLTELLHNYGQ